MHVLLGHESRVVRRTLQTSLRTTRYADAPVLHVESGGDLLRTLAVCTDPDTLAVLDWNLPGLDVPTLLAHLGPETTSGRLALVLCVNASQVPLAREAVRRGARGFVVRPFSESELGAKIAETDRGPAPATTTGSGVIRDVVTHLRAPEDLPSLLSLPSAVIADLFRGRPKYHHEAGTCVLEAGDDVLALPFVVGGEVEITAGDDPEDRLVRGAGEVFAERAFICGEPSRVRVTARTAIDLIAVPKEAMVDLARRAPALQDFLTLLLMRRPSELAGTTSSLPFADLVQFLHTTRKTGMLLLERGGASAAICFERGEACDARTGDVTGPAAFTRAASWTDARFEFRSGVKPTARTLVESTLKLLMRAFAAPPAADVFSEASAG